MKYDTYDIPAIKFYVVFGERRNQRGSVRNDEIITSFDNFDGLTIKALKDFIKDIIKMAKNTNTYNYNENDHNIIFITSALEITDRNYNNHFATSQEDYQLTICLELYDDIGDKRIDEYIEETLLKNYDEYNENCSSNKITRCFLQRYRYNTMEEVDEVLKTRTPKKLTHTKK